MQSVVVEDQTAKALLMCVHILQAILFLGIGAWVGFVLGKRSK